MSYATGLTFWDALLPGLLVALIAAAVLPLLDRDRHIWRTIVVSFCLAMMWRYLAWRVLYTLPPAGFTTDFTVGLLFICIELLSAIGATISLVILTRTRSRSSDVNHNLAWLGSLPRKPLVDVLICTYNEDESILERTIIGAQALDYDNFRLWVCDDGRRAWLETLCQRLKCGYITREDNTHAKAGNINNAWRYVSSLEEPSDFIAVLDADFVVQPAFLTRCVALTKDKQVGVVQTPQTFFNPDPIQSNLSIAHLWPDEQRYFFDVLMPSKDAWGMAFCCGTSSLIRCSALAELGGFPTDSVTEDYLLTIRLKECGYQTIYLNEELSLGLAPEGLKEYIVQRSRWCLGFMQIVRGRSGPFRLDNKLSLPDRLMLIDTFLHWSTTFTFRLCCLVVPILYLLFDIQAVYAHPTEIISYVLPFLVIQTAFTAWVTGGRVLPVLYDVSQLLVASAIVRSTIAGLMRPSGHKFKVTAKGGDRAAKLVQWSLLRVFLGFVALTAAGILWTFIIDDSRPLADATAVSLFWSWYNLLVLVLVCVATIEEPQRRKSVRFKTDDFFEITTPDKSLRLRASDVSISGIGFIGPSPLPRGSNVTVQIDGVAVPGIVVRTLTNLFGIRFRHSEESRAHLIRHMFSGRYHPSVAVIEPGTVTAGILARLGR
jgi:cellulose synthase (UDP-forming)